MKTGITSLIIIFILSFSTGLFSNNVEKSIRGRLIYVHNDYIEIKQGKSEFILYWGEGSTVVKSGSEMTRNDLYVCQIVKVDYKENQGRLEIIKVNIVRESDCLK